MLYKLFGYFHGPDYLEWMVTGFMPGDIPETTEQLSDCCDRMIKAQLRRKTAMSTSAFEVDKWKVMPLIEAWGGIMNMEKADGGATDSDMTKHVKALAAEIPYVVSQANIENESPLRQQYMTSAIEPRADEQLMIASGHIPDSLREREKQIDHSRITVYVED